MSNKVALVTGASRGIGKACPVALAEAGFDIALTARTVKEGEGREHPSTLRASDTSALPGSLDGTAELVQKAGVDTLVVAADLLDSASLVSAVATVLERKGRIDVVVHNGRYIGPGHMDLFMDTPIELLERQMQANLFAPLTINKLVLPWMIAAGGGTIVNITSASAYADPTKPAGQGGWGMGYGISKGALQPVAGFISLELGAHGVRCFNVQPGLIATERMAQDMSSSVLRMMAPRLKWLVRSCGGSAPRTAPPNSTGRVSRPSSSATTTDCFPASGHGSRPQTSATTGRVRSSPSWSKR